jgi:hypothetical protein
VSATSCTFAPTRCVPSDEDLPGVLDGVVLPVFVPVPVVPVLEVDPALELPVPEVPLVAAPLSLEVVPPALPAGAVVPSLAPAVPPAGMDRAPPPPPDPATSSPERLDMAPPLGPEGDEVPSFAEAPVEPEGATPPPDMALPPAEGLGVKPGVVGLEAVPPVVPVTLPGILLLVERLSSRPQPATAKVVAIATTSTRGRNRFMCRPPRARSIGNAASNAAVMPNPGTEGTLRASPSHWGLGTTRDEARIHVA